MYHKTCLLDVSREATRNPADLSGYAPTAAKRNSVRAGWTLLIDIGNTNIVIGGMAGDQLQFTFRLPSDVRRFPDDSSLKQLFARHGVPVSQIAGGILSSVVPALTITVGQAMKRLTGHAFLVAGPDLALGLTIRMDNPYRVGVDLLADAVGALARYAPPLAIFDMGTATTMSVVDQEGNYTGSLIIPGLRLSLDALSGKAAQLPPIDLKRPEHFLGANTVESMRSGAIYGSAAMLDGLLDRLEETLGAPVTAVATGGLASTVLPCCKRHIQYHEHLLLEGLALLYEQNC